MDELSTLSSSFASTTIELVSNQLDIDSIDIDYLEADEDLTLEDKINSNQNYAPSQTKLIQQLRNEAHRFAINFHRDRRSKSALKSGIDDLQGVGPILKDKLLKKYKSLKRLKNASEKDLIALLGNSRGKSIFNQLKN